MIEKEKLAFKLANKVSPFPTFTCTSIKSCQPILGNNSLFSDMKAVTASPTSEVFDFPPKSGVSVFPSINTFSIDFNIFLPQLSYPKNQAFD